MNYTIKQTAKIAGLSADTLRYYEKEGVISPKRRENGYRYYDERDIAGLKNIVVMKYAHFSLAEIKSMEELFTREPDADCNEVSKGILRAKIAELNRVVENYQKIVDLMEKMLLMMENADSVRSHEKQIDEFLARIFDDIQNNGL
jgi:DNA-binding transcriptional MerR regulator